jgi:hypothetical protein
MRSSAFVARAGRPATIPSRDGGAPIARRAVLVRAIPLEDDLLPAA